MSKVIIFDEVKIVFNDGTEVSRNFNASDYDENGRKHKFLKKMRKNSKVKTVDLISKVKRKILI